jgi:mRNA-degrading endonuclease RelE of RelBE toxin-antitoxin system
MYEIEYTARAVEDLKCFKRHEQQQIVGGIDVQLRYEPTVETRNRKRMQPNSFATWELRIEEFRALYNVDEQVLIVEIEHIGEKRGNTFFFRGKQEDA